VLLRVLLLLLRVVWVWVMTPAVEVHPVEASDIVDDDCDCGDCEDAVAYRFTS
jgi:hypothetical protein